MDAALKAAAVLALVLVTTLPAYGPPVHAVSDQPSRLLYALTMQLVRPVADFVQFASRLWAASCVLNDSTPREALRDATSAPLNVRFGVGAAFWPIRASAEEDCFGGCIASYANVPVGRRIFFSSDECDAERRYILHVRV